MRENLWKAIENTCVALKRMENKKKSMFCVGIHENKKKT